MIRKIIKINEEKCNGCGACATACHEGAIDIIDGVANLTRENYCDGLGDCLPACPMDAISFEEREAPAYDESAVLSSKQQTTRQKPKFSFKSSNKPIIRKQWPIQIQLMPIEAPFYQNANLLIAADCCAYVYPNFHQTFMKDHTLLIGCPKLDNVDYSIKLSEIIKNNAIQSITLVRMEIPCCNGLKISVDKAIEMSGKTIELKTITLSTNGDILA